MLLFMYVLFMAAVAALPFILLPLTFYLYKLLTGSGFRGSFRDYVPGGWVTVTIVLAVVLTGSFCFGF